MIIAHPARRFYVPCLRRPLSADLILVARAGAQTNFYRDNAFNMGLTFYREVGRMTLTAGAEYGRLEADDRLAILPQSRRDKLTRVHVGAVFRQLTVAGFAPMTRLVVDRNRSSLEFYDYKRTSTEFGVSRAF